MDLMPDTRPSADPDLAKNTLRLIFNLQRCAPTI